MKNASFYDNQMMKIVLLQPAKKIASSQKLVHKETHSKIRKNMSNRLCTFYKFVDFTTARSKLYYIFYNVTLFLLQ